MSEKKPNGFLFKQIHDMLEKRANNELRKKGLTLMQVSVLTVLLDSEENRLSMKELEKYFGVAQSTIAGIISRLEQKELVEAVGNANDKRIKIVKITDFGKKCCETEFYQREKTEKAILEGFSEEEKKTLNSFLVRVADNLK